MNDLQALKCMNEQPERRRPIGRGEAPLDRRHPRDRALPPPPLAPSPLREFMASKRPDASAAPRQIAFERFFNPVAHARTRPISRSNCISPCRVPSHVRRRNGYVGPIRYRIRTDRVPSSTEENGE